MAVSVNYLEKRSDTNSPESAKYYINCQNKITSDNPSTVEWLEILRQLKPTNFHDTNRVLLGILQKHREVVIKIGESDTLQKEYEIGQTLYKHIPGFIKYICFFKCADDFKKYPQSGRKELCEGEGEQMKVLVMPHLKLGNMRSYNWNERNYEVLLSCMQQLSLSLMHAYDMFGFIHNDTHLQNVLLKPSTKSHFEYTLGGHMVRIPNKGIQIVFMDFENSMILRDRPADGIQFVYKDIGRAFADLTYNMKLQVVNAEHILSLLNTLSITPLPLIDAYSRLAPLIDSLRFNQMPVLSLKYNPHVFGGKR